MSSGIEVLVLVPLLMPSVIGGGISAVGGVAMAGLVAAAPIAGGAILVGGAAGASLLAAQHLNSVYNDALGEYHQRIGAEHMNVQASFHGHLDKTKVAMGHVRNTSVKAAESAELTFLKLGVQGLQKRLEGWSDIDPRLPQTGVRLLYDLEQPSPDMKVCYAAYQAFNELVAAYAAKNRETLREALDSTQFKNDALLPLKKSLQIEIKALNSDITGAPTSILESKTREELKRLLGQIKHLCEAQPQLAEQGLKMLRSRVGRELSQGAEREMRRLQLQEEFAARLRTLSGRISSHASATLTVLDDEQLRASPLARAQIVPLEEQARRHIKRLSQLLEGEMPADLKPLEKLAIEADSLFQITGDKLRQIALNIYLHDQVAEVFTQLGYRVTMSQDIVQDYSATSVLAALDGGRGVEVRLDGKGNLVSELVSFSPSSTEIEPHAQEKVCDLMDEVFDALRARGCDVREKKRRHFKRGQRELRVVKENRQQSLSNSSDAAPIARQMGE